MTGNFEGLVTEKDKPGWVIEQDFPPVETGRASTGILRLLRDTQHNLEERVTYHRHVRQLLTSIGLTEGSRIDLGLNPALHGIELHTLKRVRNGEAADLLPGQEIRILNDESGIYEHVFDGHLRVLMLLEDTRIGDVIDYSYSLVEREHPYSARSYGIFPMQGNEDVLKISARILYRPEREVFARPVNCQLEPEVVYDANGLADCRWNITDAIGVEPELGTPGWYDSHPRIEYGEYISWAEVVGPECETFAVPYPLSPEVEELLAGLRAGAGTEEDFILRALAFVQEEIRYVSVSIGEHAMRPYPPQTVLARRYGDCKDKSLLFHTLLAYGGIKSKIALVNTRFRHVLDEWLPNPFAFNHVIVQISHQGGVYWIDPTRMGERGPLAMRPCPEFGKALLISPETEELVDMVPHPRQQRNRIKITETFKTGKSFAPVEFAITQLHQGEAANRLRLQLANSTHAEQVRVFTQNYALLYPGIKCLGGPDFRDDEAGNAIQMTMTFAISGLWKPLPLNPGFVHARFLCPRILDLLERPLFLERKSPFAIVHPIDLDYNLVLRTTRPFQSGHKSATFKSPAFECTVKSNAASTYYEMSAAYRSKKDHVLPVELKVHTEACANLSMLLEEIFYIPKD